MDSCIPHILKTFFSTYTCLKFIKDEIILHAEDTPQGVFFLTKGYVRQYTMSRSGVMLVFHIFKPNSFFPMTWVVNNEESRYFLDAMTPVELYRAPKEAVKVFLREHPAVVYDLTRRLLLGVSGLRRRMEYLVMDSAYKKTIFLLLYLADSVGKKNGAGAVLPMPLTHREIAAWIGTTRETASLQVEILKKSGIIHYRRRQLIILNVKALENEVSK